MPWPRWMAALPFSQAWSGITSDTPGATCDLWIRAPWIAASVCDPRWHCSPPAPRGVNRELAAPVAAALELLHNFTLIHDDVQDESPVRRHRPTVWSLWGVGQAINAGDALFAAAHLPLYRLASSGVTAELRLRLLEAFDRMTIAIVEGQTQDLAFEARPDVAPGEYLEMIAGKTAAIVRFAAWAGALLGGADEVTASRWAEFGLALGLGFQVRDDLLGIWGAQEATGKAPADDVRRRKQSLPILILRERLDEAEREELSRLFSASNVDGAGVARVLALLEREAVRQEVEAVIAGYHDRAAAALIDAAQPGQQPRAGPLAGPRGAAFIPLRLS